MQSTNMTAMTPEEIFEAAGKGQELHNLMPAEDALYSRARLIYYMFRHGELTSEQGAERRRIAMMQYERAKETERFEQRWVEHAELLYRDVEESAAAYIKEPGYKTADAMWMSITGVQAKIELQERERRDFFEEREGQNAV